jgi:FMN phosphatase YigB (HAD superfamily)
MLQPDPQQGRRRDNRRCYEWVHFNKWNRKCIQVVPEFLPPTLDGDACAVLARGPPANPKEQPVAVASPASVPLDPLAPVPGITDLEICLQTATPQPITSVLFDFHATLVDGGDPCATLDAAWAKVGRMGSAERELGGERYQRVAQQVHHLWDRVREVDPQGQRDLSPELHRAAFDALIGRLPDVDGDLAQAFYEVMPDMWRPYEDTLPTLQELKRRGIRIALVTNVDSDIRPVMARWHLLELFDAVVLSCELGIVKPQAAIFQHALDALGTAAGNALMVGDDPFGDVGAAVLGVRTLLLPRTEGSSHGLGLVLRIICG